MPNPVLKKEIDIKLGETVILHNTTGNSNKYYQIAIHKATADIGKYCLTTRWGRIGTTGRWKKTFFSTAERVINEAKVIIKNKQKKGYYITTEIKTATIIKENKNKIEQKPIEKEKKIKKEFKRFIAIME